MAVRDNRGCIDQLQKEKRQLEGFCFGGFRVYGLGFRASIQIWRFLKIRGTFLGVPMIRTGEFIAESFWPRCSSICIIVNETTRPFSKAFKNSLSTPIAFRKSLLGFWVTEVLAQFVQRVD